MNDNTRRSTHEHFEARTEYTRSAAERTGFDHGCSETGYAPPGCGDITPEREEYDQGFENGGYTKLNEAYPGILEETTEMRLALHSSQEDVIGWLLAPVDDKYGAEFSENLAAYLTQMRTRRITSYG